MSASSLILSLAVAGGWPAPGRPAPDPAVSDVPTTTDAAVVAVAADDIDAVVQRHSLGTFWGGVLVVRNGEIVLARGYGLANEELAPITADSLFDIGSNAKSFTATAILALEADGALALDDPVIRFFPDGGAGAGDVTLKHLLTHTSGLSDQGALQRLDFPDRDEAVRIAFRAGRTAAPGRRFEYCNAGYVILAAVIEKASGLPFEDYLRERLFAPAGMVSTGFLDGVGVDASRGTARVVSRGPTGRPRRLGILNDGWGWGLRGAGGILTTLNDLARWERAFAAGTIIGADARERLFRVEKSSYALGWYVARTAHGGRKIHHSGGTRGYRSQIALYPEDDVLIAVLTNTEWDPIALEKAIATALWPEERADIEATMNVGHLVLDELGLATFEKGAAWTVTAAGSRVALVLTAPPNTTEAARIVMPSFVATRLADQIEDIIGGTVPRPTGRDTTTLLATKVYTPGADGSIRLAETVEWLVMPMYRGMTEDGRPVTDERTTIVLADADAGFWPIIIKMEPADAAQLATALTDAIP